MKTWMKLAAGAGVATLVLAMTGCRSAIDYYQEGVFSMEGGEYQRALDAFTTAADRFEEPRMKALAFVNQGDALFAVHQYRQAVESYDRAIEIDAYNPWTYSLRGRAYYAMSDFAAARTDFQEADRLEGVQVSLGFNYDGAPAAREMRTLREHLLAEIARQPGMNETAGSPTPTAAETAMAGRP